MLPVITSLINAHRKPKTNFPTSWLREARPDETNLRNEVSACPPPGERRPGVGGSRNGERWSYYRSGISL